MKDPKILQESSFFYNGKCMFCGNESEEHFFSGSYDSYEDCDCEQRKKYYECKQLLHNIKKIAEDRFEMITLEEEIKETETRLKHMKSSLEKMKK